MNQWRFHGVDWRCVLGRAACLISECEQNTEDISILSCSFLVCCGPARKTWRVYRGADKSLARPGRKQATATEDFEFHISYL